MKLRPYQKAAIANLPASIIGGLADIATLLQTEPREATVDAIEARPAAAPMPKNIRRIDTDALDHLLAPYIEFGILSTAYHAVTGATVYSTPLRTVIALSIGSNHFANADTAPHTAINPDQDTFGSALAQYAKAWSGALAASVASIPTPVRLTDPKAWDDVPPVPVSPALHMQKFGRVKRIPQPEAESALAIGEAIHEALADAVITLEAYDLFDKFGFGDGDMFDHLLDTEALVVEIKRLVDTGEQLPTDISPPWEIDVDRFKINKSALIYERYAKANAKLDAKHKADEAENSRWMKKNGLAQCERCLAVGRAHEHCAQCGCELGETVA
ncbi:hypothetical protein [Pseudomonas sp.]|uniref:hypothetical protein n=1 Tax=Pseudomonas sp. TaxID=306 RepID=UPI003FD82469